MIFDSKAYFYYFVTSLGRPENRVSDVVEMLGDFEIKPGSLKKEETDEKDYSFVSRSVKLENPNVACHMISYSRFDEISIDGYLNDNSISIELSNIKSNDNKCMLGFSIIERGVGLHILDPIVFNKNSFNTEPCYAFYDEETLSTLKRDFGYDEEEILSKNILRMEKIGFKPDKSYFLPEKNSMYDFAHNIFTKYSLEELKSQLNGMSNNNSTAKHLSLENKTNE